MSTKTIGKMIFLTLAHPNLAVVSASAQIIPRPNFGYAETLGETRPPFNFKNMKKSFIEICLYEVKLDKTNEFEALIKKVSDHHRKFPGVIDVRYMKRTHRPTDFVAVKKGKPAIKLSKKSKSVTYALYWELNDEIVHGKATKSGLKNFFKDFQRCLVVPPKIILGQRIQ